MVATEVLDDDHVPPDTVELNVVVPLEQTSCAPESMPALGRATIVTDAVAVRAGQSPEAKMV